MTRIERDPVNKETAFKLLRDLKDRGVFSREEALDEFIETAEVYGLPEGHDMDTQRDRLEYFIETNKRKHGKKKILKGGGMFRKSPPESP